MENLEENSNALGVNEEFEEIIDSSAEALDERLPPMVPKDGGIENCYLTKVEILQKNNVDDRIQFTFVQKAENNSIMAEFKHVEWNPYKPAYDGATKDDIIRSSKDTAARIKHIFARYVDSKTLEIKVAGFFNWCRAIMKLVPTSAYAGKVTKLKVIYNKAGYIKFPKYPPFVSTEFSPREFSFDPKYDLLTKANSGSAITDAPNGDSSDVEEAFG